MFTFIAKRIGAGSIVLVSVVLLISAIIYLAPVDPARLTFGQRSDNQTVLAKQKELGLDQPLHQQMIGYLSDISPIWIYPEAATHRAWASLPLGAYTLALKPPYLRNSYQSGKPVVQLLAATIPKTLILACAAFVFAAIFGILFGVISAVRAGTWIDRTLLFVSTIGISVPSYVSAICFALTFGFLWADITGLNMQGSLFELNDYGDDVVVWKNLLLPALALGIRPISIITQLSRSAMLDVLKSPYIQTARSKGLLFSTVVTRHALRNAMNPIVTSLSGWFASLLAGAFFVEQVFNYRGLGQLTINALTNYDVPVILACLLFIAGVFIVINILTDILYTFIDPKVSLD